MPSNWRPYLLPFAALLCYWGMLIYYLGAQWSILPDYHYGWAVPFLCAYLLMDRWQNHPQGPAHRLSGGGFRASALKPFIWPIIGGFAVLFAILYGFTRLFHEVAPIWRLTSWLWTLELMTLTLVLLWLRLGFHRALHLAPAIIFFLIAVPWPSTIAGPVQRDLAFLNTRISTEALQLLGIPALQRGKVIEISGGLLGIDKACSGIQSLQASIMIGLFFGILYRLGALRTCVLLLSGAALAFCLNILRTTSLGFIAASHGMDAARWWHDPLGTGILLICFFSLWLFVRLVKQERNATAKGERLSGVAKDPPVPLTRRVPVSAVCLVLLAWFAVVEIGIEAWYRSHTKAVRNPETWSIRWPEDYSLQKLDLGENVQESLRYDLGESFKWSDFKGRVWQGIFFDWRPAYSVYDRVKIARYHSPEGCNKAAGWKLTKKMPLVQFNPSPDVSLDFRHMVFDNGPQRMHLFLAVSQYGSDGLPLISGEATRWDLVKEALSGSRVLAQRSLEIGIFGIEDPNEAVVLLQEQLATMIE